MSDQDDHLSPIPRPLVGGKKRLDILDAAIGVIVARGFDSTRYQDVASRVSRSAFSSSRPVTVSVETLQT